MIGEIISGQQRHSLSNNLTLSISIWSTLAAVHSAGFFIGDLSTANLYASLDYTGRIALIDVDSWGVLDGAGSALLQATHLPEQYRPPEAPADRWGMAGDVFLATILTLQLLLDVNPFSGVYGDASDTTPQDNIDQSHCWLLDDRNINLPSRYRTHPGLQALPNDVATRLGLGLSFDPAQRPSAQEIFDLIGSLRPATGDCGHDLLLGGSCHRCIYVGARPSIEKRVLIPDELVSAVAPVAPVAEPTRQSASPEAVVEPNVTTPIAQPRGLQLRVFVGALVMLALAIGIIAFAIGLF